MDKFYFATAESELCFPKQYHLDVAKMKGLKNIMVFEAIPDKVEGFFFCRFFSEIGEKGNCGKHCTEYLPRNGKSGICQFYSTKMFSHGKQVILPLD